MLLAALLVLLALTGSTGPAQPARAAGAVGIVVRHSDGRLLYAYIPLTGDSITGGEALQKSGLALNVTVGGVYGVAVCQIDGEGCVSPQEDCFCKSYGTPSFYWHYYFRNADGTWRNASLGAGNRVLHDGDIDGWSWTSGESALPPVTLQQIATIVRPARATGTPLPAPTPAATGAPTTAPPQVAALATATTDTQPRAAAVGPSGSVTPVQPAAQSSASSRGRAIAGFMVVAVVMIALLALVPLGARRRRYKAMSNEQ